tara:strand:- start:317 stop:481 length:165 start_codon:yes stop_codon:yes gene_type:complete
MPARGSRIQTALGLFVPYGLRALRSLQIAGAAFEPSTRGFSVDSVTDFLIESMS